MRDCAISTLGILALVLAQFLSLAHGLFLTQFLSLAHGLFLAQLRCRHVLVGDKCKFFLTQNLYLQDNTRRFFLHFVRFLSPEFFVYDLLASGSSTTRFWTP